MQSHSYVFTSYANYMQICYSSGICMTHVQSTRHQSADKNHIRILNRVYVVLTKCTSVVFASYTHSFS